MKEEPIKDLSVIGEGPLAPYTEDHLRQVEEFRAKNFGNVMPVSQGPKIAPLPSAKNYAKPTKGTFEGGIYQVPNQPRRQYMITVNEEAYATKYINFKPITSKRVVFREHVDQLNLFHPYFIEVFDAFLSRYDQPQIVVSRGFVPPSIENLSPHSIGMAIDIHVSTRDEMSNVMNTAWLAGIPTILHAGDRSDEMHVHLDICPKEEFLYDGEYYEGPWSLSYVRA